MAIYGSIAAARALDSFYSLSVAGGLNVNLTIDQAAPRVLKFTGALTANIVIVFPVVAGDIGSWWLLENATSGSFTLAIQAASGGAAPVIAQGKRCIARWNGSDMVCEDTDLAAIGAAARGSNSDITALLAITGGITGTGGLNIDKVQGNVEALGSGMLAKALPDTNYTLTGAERANGYLTFTGALTAGRNVVVPTAPANTAYLWDVFNGTNQILTFIGATGTGTAVGIAKRARIANDGVNTIRISADNP